MKRILFCGLCLLLLCGSLIAYAQQPASSTAAPQSKAAANPVAPRIDPAKEAAIRRFMQLTGGESISTDIANQMKVMFRPTIEDSLPPGEYRVKLVDLLLEKFGARFTTEIVMPMVMSVYARRFSLEELNQLIAFYESPLGKKVSSVLHDIDAESQKIPGGSSEKMLQECMEQVLAEHPELNLAMEKAEKNEKTNPAH